MSRQARFIGTLEFRGPAVVSRLAVVYRHAVVHRGTELTGPYREPRNYFAIYKRHYASQDPHG